MPTQFHWADYVVFSISLCMGLGLGLISMITQRKDKTSKSYLLGGGDMNMVLVGASLQLSKLNAVFLLGGTAEIHYR